MRLFLVQEKSCELLASDSENDIFNIHELIPLSFSCLLVCVYEPRQSLGRHPDNPRGLMQGNQGQAAERWDRYSA